MNECEQELSPFGIIKHLNAHPGVSPVLSRQMLSVLDLGCANPAALYVLYHDFNFQRLIGVDLGSEKHVVAHFLKQCNSQETSVPYKTIYDLYIRYLSFDEQDRLEGKTHLTEMEFRNTFQIHFETRVKSFLRDNGQPDQFDYVILSNLLHLMDHDDALFVCRAAIKTLKPGGIFYVRVNHEENPNATKYRHFAYNENNFLDLFKPFEEIRFCKSVNDGGPGIKSMVYFGKKR